MVLCDSTALFPTPPLVSPKFPHVPLGVFWATKSEDVGLFIVRAISFQDFQHFLIHQRHRRTDGQTNRQRTDDMQSQCRAMDYSVSRGKNEVR